MEKKLQALYGLKFNPFTPSLPTNALHRNQAIEEFCWMPDYPEPDHSPHHSPSVADAPVNA